MARKKYNYEESETQKRIVSALRGRGIVVFLGGAVDGDREPYQVQHAKDMGYNPGQPDLIVVLKDKVLLLEVKSPTGDQSEAQKLIEERVADSTAAVYKVVRSVQDVLTLLTQ